MDIFFWRDRLERRREEIRRLQALSSESRATVELDQTSVGRVSRIDAIQAQELALAAERRRQEELVRIEAALRRISNGTYGECLRCGEEIAESRLAFDPAIAMCISCAGGKRA